MIREVSAIAEHHGVDDPCAPLSVLPMSRRRRATAAPAPRMPVVRNGAAPERMRGAPYGSRPPRSAAVSTNAPSVT
jgi:hypothetical protein